ncbi:MAG: SDR family NAD(P)-dependent oxidoreductase [Planctomycetaceae bacterium]
MSLSGKTVLITGGGTGIGAACAIALAKEGCNVVITGRREERLKETAAQFDGDPAIKTYVCDVGDRDAVNKMFAWAAEELGDIDILINSAGVNTQKRLFAELSPDDWDKLLRINATGAYNTMHAVIPQMRERKDGLIINVASIAGLRAGLLGGVAYNASKFAMRALGLSVNNEFFEEGIRVTNIHPGEVDTPILENRPTPVTDEHRARILQPEDVAAAVVMVAKLPPRANVTELTIKPTTQSFA